MKLTKRESRLVTIAVLFMALALYYFYYLSPLLDEYFVLKQIVVENQEKLENLNQIELEQKGLKSKIEEYKKEIADLENILPSNMRLPEIIVSLEQMAHASGVKLQGIAFGAGYDLQELNKDEKDKRDFLEIPIELTISGTYENELNFLKLLEDYPRLFKINKISVAQAFQASVENIRLNIGLSTFTILHNNQLLSDFKTYEFMTGEYGRANPFVPINQASSKGQANSFPNYNNFSNQKDENKGLTEFMEEFIKQLKIN